MKVYFVLCVAIALLLGALGIVSKGAEARLESMQAALDKRDAHIRDLEASARTAAAGLSGLEAQVRACHKSADASLAAANERCAILLRATQVAGSTSAGADAPDNPQQAPRVVDYATSRAAVRHIDGALDRVRQTP